MWQGFGESSWPGNLRPGRPRAPWGPVDERRGPGRPDGSLDTMTSARTPEPAPARQRAARVDGPALVLALAGASPEQRDDLRRALARLAALDAAHLSPLCGIAERSDGFTLTHAVAPGSVSWSELTDRRAATPAETVAVGLALCQALGALHTAGLAHGDVRPDRLLVSGAGIVELTGCGAAWTPGVRLAVVAADDVTALCAVLAAGIGPADSGAELARLVRLGADPDPAHRPAVSALGLALEAWGTPSLPDPELFTRGVPTSDPLGDGAPRDSDDSESTAAPAARVGSRPESFGALRTLRSLLPWFRSWSRGREFRAPVRPVMLTLAALIGLGLLARGVSGLVVRQVDHPAAPASQRAGHGEPDWPATVARLDAMRAAAMAGGSAIRLAAAVDPEGPAFARDVATMAARGQAGLRLLGGATTVRSAVALQVGADRAELEVVDTRTEFRLLGPTGRVVLAGPARSSMSWRVSLVRDGSGQPWRIHDAVRR